MSRNGREEFFYDPNTMMQHQHQQQQQQHHYHQFMMHQQHMNMQWLHQQQLYQWQMQHQMRPFIENAENGEGWSRNVVMMMPMPVPRFKPTTLDRLMRAVMPFIEVQYLAVESNGSTPGTPFYYLGALWESYSQWSAYGACVPLLLNGKDLTDQYYVPFLSGIQVYAEPSKDSSQQKLPSEETDAKSLISTGRSSTPEAAVDNKLKSPVFEYLEREAPHNRRPLADKISVLVSKNPELAKYRSCDILPESWMCVAWYPIYRIPLGPTMKDLEASFLTFHSLSTHSKGNRFSPLLHPANTRRIHGCVDRTEKISLPVFALASYKLRGSLVGPCGSHEYNQEDLLWKTGDDWLKGLQARLPDYDFFRSHHRK